MKLRRREFAARAMDALIPLLVTPALSDPSYDIVLKRWAHLAQWVNNS